MKEKELTYLHECLLRGKKDNEPYTVQMCNFDVNNLFNPYLPTFRKDIDYDYLKYIACELMGIDAGKLYSRTRKRDYVFTRQMMMKLYVEDFKLLNLTDCGKLLGGKDHSTVIHGLKQINNLLDVDTSIQQDYNVLQSAFSKYLFEVNN